MEPGIEAPRNPHADGEPARAPSPDTLTAPPRAPSGVARLIPRPRRADQATQPASTSVAGHPSGTAPGDSTGGETLAQVFTGPNCLSAQRLMFAWVVLLLHGLALSGHHTPALGKHEYDAVALDGFFAISGLLVTHSARRLPLRRFIRHRALRILPGFWVCLIFVAFVIAPLGWLHVHGTLHGYPLTGPHGALHYVTDNALVRMRFYDIGGTPTGTFFPAPGSTAPLAWDGSMWSLWWEVQCYLGILALALVGLLRRRPVLVIGAITLGLALVEALGPAGILPARLSPDMFRFALNFLAGSIVCLYADRIPVSGRIAAVAGVVFVGSHFVQDMPLISAMPLAYLCAYLGIRVPLHRLGTRRDLSYGLYIYGFPIQQLATVYGLHRQGILVYLPVTVVVTVVLAAASWYLVEAPALRHKSPRPRSRPGAHSTRAIRRTIGTVGTDTATLSSTDTGWRARRLPEE
ncbi:acyltransferase family protein [Frankia sp. AgPm24]|uniref:acyltransferase family protein n=1 Tax=Frankia sp. AgPm24 TaxID=631128 RepID=UPI00200E6F7A|nr:acyltransferase [Frankia sp. AgPm24]MCK9920315.1 acyltransferase family protein [Frankia sp. AgPm24]